MNDVQVQKVKGALEEIGAQTKSDLIAFAKTNPELRLVFVECATASEESYMKLRGGHDIHFRVSAKLTAPKDDN